VLDSQFESKLRYGHNFGLKITDSVSLFSAGG
jgi:hypothetical protein